MATRLPLAPENFLPAATTNFPQYLNAMPGGAVRSALAFDATTSEKCRSQAFKAPQNLTGAITVVVTFAIAATTGNVQFRAQIEAITPADALNVNTATSFDTANSSGAIAVPGTTYNTKDITITCTNADTIAAGDLVQLTLDRDVTVASNAAGDCYVLAVEFRDAA